jgi:hypothetical protein
VRQGIALGLGVLILILLVLGVRGCVSNRHERALKDYNRSVTSVIQDSDEQVGKPFFELMAAGAREGSDLPVQVNQLRLAADEDAARAKKFGVPDEMAQAQDNLLLVLNLRAGAVRKIADKIPAALGRGTPSQRALDQIAGQMQAFLASDVVHSQRVAPLIKEALDDAGIKGQRIAASRFLPNLSWLDPSTVAASLGRTASGGDNTAAVAPGLHGHGLVSVSVGGVTLQPAPAVNRIPAGSGVTFTVKFANQGDNDESNVKVSVRVRGAGQPISAQKTIGQTKAKSPAEVSIPLGQAPPVGQTATVDVVVAKVPGEKKTDNNRQSYTVIFTR